MNIFFSSENGVLESIVKLWLKDCIQLRGQSSVIGGGISRRLILTDEGIDGRMICIRSVEEVIRSRRRRHATLEGTLAAWIQGRHMV